jgi:hypothetical protein
MANVVLDLQSAVEDLRRSDPKEADRIAPALAAAFGLAEELIAGRLRSPVQR